MTLNRIWTAFILVAILMAVAQAIVSKDGSVFTQMVTGKSDDAIDSTYYTLIEDPKRIGYSDQKAYEQYLAGFGWRPADANHPAHYLVGSGDSNAVYTYKQLISPRAERISFEAVNWRLHKRADGIIETCKTAVTISIGLVGIMALFMGMLSIAEQAGGVRLLSRMIAPFFSRLFPGVPAGHPAFGHMMMNFSANLLGLDNAATPFGIKAMESLQTLNAVKERASNAQIMFLALHASGLTLIPVSIIAARSALKSTNPTDVFLPCMIATFVATAAALIVVGLRQRINLLHPTLIAWLGGVSAFMAGLIWLFVRMPTDVVRVYSSLLSNGLILLLFFAILLGSAYKRVSSFDAFVVGAKGGFETAIRIIPYLVGMLVAISMLRTSGTFDLIINSVKSGVRFLGADSRFVDALPTALIKPLSGSGARGMMIDTMRQFGPDSFAGRLACILQGSSDTTFYVVAIYYGAVSVRDTRYSVGAMLLADLAGVLSAIGVCYLFFGEA